MAAQDGGEPLDRSRGHCRTLHAGAVSVTAAPETEHIIPQIAAFFRRQPRPRRRIRPLAEMTGARPTGILHGSRRNG